MASGYFPLEKNNLDGAHLDEISNELERLTHELHDAVLEQDQTDNIASDSMHVGDLYHAIRLIRSTLEQ
jgi:metal-dependent HD superfamily phosphatase/phosphodiesterase